ncbi:MAG: hypothetical protein J5723_09605 [Ruminococcus sp.]|nr:hypothetical protein [Ruminococcus sp.]
MRNRALCITILAAVLLLAACNKTPVETSGSSIGNEGATETLTQTPTKEMPADEQPSDELPATNVPIGTETGNGENSEDLTQAPVAEPPTIDMPTDLSKVEKIETTGVYETNTFYRADLDNDGTEETFMVEYELDGNAPIGFPRAYINGRQVYAGEYVMSPNSDYFGFLRFGAEGSRAYIAVYSDGSEDPFTELLMWDGSSMTVAATIPDCLFAYEYPSESSATPVISGIALSKIKTDRIEYTTRFEFVQMWDETGAYYVAADGCITRDDSTRQFRPVIPDAVMLKYALTVPADSGATEVQLALGKYYLDDTDGSTRIHLTSQDDPALTAWIDVTNLDSLLTEENRGKGISPYDLFEGTYRAG